MWHAALAVGTGAKSISMSDQACAGAVRTRSALYGGSMLISRWGWDSRNSRRNEPIVSVVRDLGICSYRRTQWPCSWVTFSLFLCWEMCWTLTVLRLIKSLLWLTLISLSNRDVRSSGANSFSRWVGLSSDLIQNRSVIVWITSVFHRQIMLF